MMHQITKRQVDPGKAWNIRNGLNELKKRPGNKKIVEQEEGYRNLSTIQYFQEANLK